MKQISSLDLYFLTKEFKVLENNRVETFYMEDDVFYMKVYVKGKGHIFLTTKLGKYIFLNQDKQDESSVPKSFIQFLRKFLKNGFVQKIEQVENERILNIQISKKVSNDSDEFKIFNLIIEMFANGNIILCDEKNQILNSFQKKKFKDRTIMVRDTYSLPPKKEISIFNLDKNKLTEQLSNSDLSIVKFLAIKLGIGGKFSEEIIFNSKIDKNKLATQIDEKEIKTLIIECKKLIESKIKPQGIYKKGELNDFTPINLNSIKDEKKEFDNFNNLIFDYFIQFKSKKDKVEEELKLALKKLQNRLKKQNKQKEEIFIKSDEFTKIGNKIYENYTLVEELLNSINLSAKEKGWDSVKETIKNNEKLNKVIKKINPDKNEIILDLK